MAKFGPLHPRARPRLCAAGRWHGPIGVVLLWPTSSRALRAPTGRPAPGCPRPAGAATGVLGPACVC
eukprot:2528482-Lingulodinium_polyedra.AAC.1